MTAPHVSLGNTATDVGHGISTFIKGLMEERDRQSKLALQQALIDAKTAEMNKPEWNIRPAINPATGHMEYTRMDSTGRAPSAFTGLGAPEYQMDVPGQDAKGNPLNFTRSRAIPDAPARPVPMPSDVSPRTPNMLTPTVTGGQLTQTITNPGHPKQEGQVVAMPPNTSARPAPSIPMITESPTGQGGVVQNVPRTYGGGGVAQVGGQPVQARATEADERRARDAFEMIQGQTEMKRVANVIGGNGIPAAQEAAAYIASMNIGEGVPIIGHEIEALINQGQSALSPAAAQYFSSFMHFASARAFSRGGMTLTRNEINYSLMSLSPKAGEDESTSSMRTRLVNNIIQGSIAGNPAWNRYRETARQFGYDENASLVPPPAPKPNRFTGVARP